MRPRPRLSDDLVERTFSHVFDATTRGAFPAGSWRLHLLTTARNLALREWAYQPDGPFDAYFRHWASTGGTWSLTQRSRLTQAYRMLPERRQTSLWHSIVEREGRATTIACLGMRREQYGPLTGRARANLHDNYLTLHQQTVAPSTECTMYVPLLAASVESESTGQDPEPTRARAHVADHLADCTVCREAYEDLSDLDGQLRAQLPPLLLGWWPGPVYHALRTILLTPVQRPAFLREAVRSGPPPERRRTSRPTPYIARPFAMRLATATVGTCLAIASYDALTRPPAEERADGVTSASDPAATHGTTGTPHGRSEARKPTPLTRTPGSSPPTPSPTNQIKTTTSPTSVPQAGRPSAEPRRLDATQQIRADGYTLQQGAIPVADGSVVLQAGSQLRFDNIDFGETPKKLARLQLAAMPSAPDTHLSLRFDDAATPSSTLAVRASPEPRTVEIFLAEDYTGVHTLHIDVTCTDAGPCVSLFTLSFG
ncbi:hypothetical protein [Streptomyces sp. NPDC001530]|uniref:hypothetical protein n=1 Tax=Streptomyces sp. NPDC001530 TaxID=3364582 RepID=UPI0036B68B1C